MCRKNTWKEPDRHTRELLRRTGPECGTARTDEARFESGAVLLSGGAQDRHVLLLLSGFAKVTATVENGGMSLLAVRVGGDTVGEAAAMDGVPCSAAVAACGPMPVQVLQPAYRTAC
ncbi:cyclic nucleotide-binding domain-containing protein [Streptomyces sp. NBC_00989]|uniref:cyclic nucleotide-binding domain-containing protein n=1 Tax=Streptomyces sp. NBC_00989 TaxID=2903705 RepID=UPI0038681960|nr:cyclic nucleotide-binding domain-containing protein [Streptomyces sp. NBC_00989]